MRYSEFDLEDFLDDIHFQMWVKEAKVEDNHFWNQFQLHHPEKREVIEMARGILLGITSDMESMSPNPFQINHMWDKIQTEVNAPSRRTPFGWPWFSKLSVAAAVALLLLTSGWFLWPTSQKRDITYAKLIDATEIELVEKKNTNHRPIVLSLPDSSQVTLEPQTTISYPLNFNTAPRREVYLSGQAFFHVKRNENRPFFVYANELVTKVLGTSFIVKAFEGAKQMEVVVKTGRVAVFTRECNMEMAQLPQETILTPNHRVLYTRERERMEKYLVETPEIMEYAMATPPIVDFQDAHVSEVFKNLEDAYGIDIVYDQELMKNCLLTASFSQESLYDKIDLICKGIEAEFAVVNAQIVVTGKGCQ